MIQFKLGRIIHVATRFIIYDIHVGLIEIAVLSRDRPDIRPFLY